MGSGGELMFETAQSRSAHCESGSGGGLMSETAQLGVGREEEWKSAHSGQRSGGGLMSETALPRAREAESGGSQTHLGSLQVRGPASRVHCPKEGTQQVRGSKPRSAGPFPTAASAAGIYVAGREQLGVTRPSAAAGIYAAARGHLGVMGTSAPTSPSGSRRGGVRVGPRDGLYAEHHCWCLAQDALVKGRVQT